MIKFLSWCFVLWMPALLAAASGRVLESLTLPSAILGMERKYSVYLPPDYDTAQRRYPVLYLLHGSGDDETAWIQFGEVQHLADAAIANGTATPMVIVMPDANTGRRGYYNDPKGQWRYEDYFVQEFMPFIERKYRIRAEKQFRAIAGNSMGGGGSFLYALRHPELFAAACPLSPEIGPLNLEGTKRYLGWVDRQESYTEEELQKFYEYRSTLRLIAELPEDKKKAVKWYIDCGDDDRLYEGSSLVHIALKKREIPHEFRIREGYHNWLYWRQSLPAVLEFISDSFHRK